LQSTLGTRIGRALLCASLLCPPPSPAATDAPLGVVLQANLAYFKQSAITEGATVYAGEELSTDVGGSVDLRIADSRFSLAANSRAHFYQGTQRAVAELTDGTLTFRRGEGADGIEVVASDVRIVPQGEGAVTGQVTIFSPCKITITSLTGAIEVTTGKETRTVLEKEAYSVTPEISVLAAKTFISPDDADYHQSHVHKACALAEDPNRSGRFRKIALAAGLGGGAILAGIKFLTSSKPGEESPTKP
jgi:hypothetical protein